MADIELINKKFQEGMPLTDEEQTFLGTQTVDMTPKKEPERKPSGSTFMQRLLRELNPLPSAQGAVTDESLASKADRLQKPATQAIIPQQKSVPIAETQPAETPEVSPVEQASVQATRPTAEKPSESLLPTKEQLKAAIAPSPVAVDDELKAAQDAAAKQRLIASLIGAGTQIGIGAVKGKYTPEMAAATKQLVEQSEQPVVDILQRRKAATEQVESKAKADLEDPNSSISKLTRDMMSKIGMKVPENTSAGQLKRAGVDVDKLLMVKEARDVRAAEKAKKPIVTKAQEAVDKKFAQEYNDFVVAGGFEDAQKGIKQLKEASEALKTQSLTGPLTGITPDVALSILNPEAIEVRDKVQEVVQRNLRLVLGAQFTQKEGEMLLARAYNPRLSEQENKRRVDRLIKQIEGAARAKMNASKYYEEHGTLQGFKGTLINSVDDIIKGIEGKDEKTTTIDKGKTTTLPGTEAQRKIADTKNEIRRKTKDGKIAIFDATTKQFLRYE